MEDISVNKFLEMATWYMEQLDEQTKDLKISKDLEMIRYDVTRHISPHLKVLKLIDRDNKEFLVENESDNESDKEDFLSKVINYSKDGEKILNFLNDKIYGSKLTHVIIPNTKCEKCKKLIFKEKPYIPIVPYLFFL